MEMRQLGTADLALLEQLSELLADCAFSAKDSKLRYVAANTAMARLCGVKRPCELYGKTANDFFPEKVARHYQARDRRILATGQPMTRMLDRWMEAGSGPVWVLCTRTPIRDSAGQIVGTAEIGKRFKPAGNQTGLRRAAKAAERLRSAYNRPLQLDELANEAGVSKSQLSRDFLRCFGQTPREFLQTIRLERAQQLLESSLSIAEIAYECGYTDHSAFTRRFRKATGSSPRDYRNRLPAPAGSESLDI